MDSDCHRRVLKEMRVHLVEHLDLKNTSLLDQLIQDDVVSSAQVKAMKDKYVSNRELASSLVCHLERCSSDQWKTFLRCLEIHDQKGIARTLSCNIGVLGEDADRAIRECQQRIAGVIKEHFDQVPIWTLHSDHSSVPMDEQYVVLQLANNKYHGEREENTIEGYRDILRKSTFGTTIYLTGEPGAGKTMLTRRICVDWAKIIQADDPTVPPGDLMESYQYVLALFLRAVRKGDTLSQVIEREYRLQKRKAEALCKHIENTQRPILLVVDGLDEYDEATSTEITEIIHKKRLRHITLLITSRRPSNYVFADDDSGPGIEFMLMGFSPEGVQEYIKKFYHDNLQEGDALLEELKQSENLVHLSHIPAVLLMMATLWQENHHLARTLTGFYEEYVAYVFARMEKKKKIKMTERAKSTTDLIKRYHQKLISFGRLACGTLAIPLELIFHREDVLKHISPDDLQIGLLLEKQTFSGQLYYIFPHKTVQEFLFAFHVVNSDTDTRTCYIKLLSKKGCSGWYMIRRFMVGIGGRKMLNQIMTVVETVNLHEDGIVTTRTESQLEYLAEHQDAKLTLPREVYLELDYKYPESHYVRYLTQEGGEVEKLVLSTNPERYFRLLQHLHAPNLIHLTLYIGHVSYYDIDTCYINQTLDESLRKFPLKHMKIDGVDEEASDIFKAVSGSLLLEAFSIEFTTLTNDQTHTLIMWLPESKLEYLGLKRNQEGWVMKVIASIPMTLKRLSIDDEWLHGIARMPQQLSVIANSCLRSLRLSDCCLDSSDVLAVFSYLPESVNELHIRKNDLKGLSKTEVLDVTRARFKPLRKRPCMEDLSSLTRTNLETLDISKCKLTPQDVIAAIRSLPQTLTDLDMSGNCRDGADALTGLTDAKEQLKKVKRLSLAKINIPNHVVENIKQQLALTCPQLSLEGLKADGDETTDSDDATDSDEATDGDASTDSE